MSAALVTRVATRGVHVQNLPSESGGLVESLSEKERGCVEAQPQHAASSSTTPKIRGLLRLVGTAQPRSGSFQTGSERDSTHLEGDARHQILAEAVLEPLEDFAFAVADDLREPHAAVHGDEQCPFVQARGLRVFGDVRIDG